MKETEFKSAIANWQSAILSVLTLAFSLQPLALPAASSPFLIPYQGRLTNPQGVPYTNGQYTIAFTLYDQAVGGNVKWGPETHYKVGVINGMVNVFLGSITTLSNVDFSETRHLGITIYADNNPNNPAPEMVPRQMIIPAFWAKNSEKLAGYDWTQIFGANSPAGPIPGGKIQNNSITAGQIAPQTITAAQVANNTITSQQLAGAIITSNQIVAGSISSQNLAPGSVGTTSIADGAVTLAKFAPRQTLTNVVGVGGIAISLPVTSFNTSSSTYVDVPNLTVTITTLGRPVHLMLVPDSAATNDNAYVGAGAGAGSTANTMGCGINVVVDGSRSLGTTSIFWSGANSTVNSIVIPVSSVHFVDFYSSAGPHTYKVQIEDLGSYPGAIYKVRLVAYEL